MRARLSVCAVLLVFIVFAAMPSHAANWLERDDEGRVISRLKEWRERLPELVKRILKYGPKTTGDHMSPPKP